MDGLDKVKAWSVELLCYWMERYNGFGYRAHGIRRRSRPQVQMPAGHNTKPQGVVRSVGSFGPIL